MVIYRSTERNRSSFVICQRRGGQPHVEYNCTPSTRLPRFPFFQREKERLDPFNALLSGRSSIVTAGVSRREPFPNRLLPFQREKETVGKFVARRNFVPPFVARDSAGILARHRRGHLDIRRHRLFSLMTR